MFIDEEADCWLYPFGVPCSVVASDQKHGAPTERVLFACSIYKHRTSYGVPPPAIRQRRSVRTQARSILSRLNRFNIKCLG
jgi:hypothetical protein